MTEKMDVDSKTNEFDANTASHKMDLQSRTIAALGVETMKNLSSLTVLIIGLRGVGAETAKNLILTGPKKVALYDDAKVQIADLGANFYISEDQVGKCSRSEACGKRLGELNPYCNVDIKSGELTDEYIQSFGAVVVTQILPRKELVRINELCRSRKPSPSAFILAITQGISAHFFTDFGAGHVVNDADGEPARTFVVDELDEDGVVTVAAKRHGFDDGDEITLDDVEGAPKSDDKESVTELNGLSGMKVKRIYYKYDFKRADGKTEKREKQVFQKFKLDLSGTKLSGKSLSKWKTGGLVSEVKPKKELSFRSLQETLVVPAVDGLAAFFGPQHPDQGAWEQGSGKMLHLLFAGVLQFEEEKGFFPRLHSEDDSRALKSIVVKINAANKKAAEDGKQGAVFVEDSQLDTKRINGYAWYFQSELTGYCAFLGGVAAQEVVKKFGKYTPIFQWLHCDHIQLIGNEVPSDAVPQNCRYDCQISIFGKSFQKVLSNQRIFLVGTGALGCEYLKGLAMMGISCGPNGKVTCTDMDRIEISNLSRQFLFRAQHVGQPKSTTAAKASQEMNPSFNVEALEMKVWSETEDRFDDAFWDTLDLCWNALDNVHARKYTDNKCLLHSKPLLESGTQGTKCNSEVIIPYKTKSYNDGEEQETEGIPMCTLQNFPYIPEHCIEWARAAFNKFESLPKLYNTFMEDTDKFMEQINTAQGEERYEIAKTMERFIAVDAKNLYAECIRLSFDEFVLQHVTRIKNLIHLFPEDEKIKDKESGKVSDFWTGHKKFPQVPKFDLNEQAVLEYMYASSQLWAFALCIPKESQPQSIEAFKKLAEACKLTVPEWKPPVGLKIDVDENGGDDDGGDDDADNKEDEEAKEAKEKEIEAVVEKLKTLKKEQLLQKMQETDFEKDDDTNFHIDFITAVANTRARNYRIRESSRHQCKIIAGKIIPALATTTAMICGLMELEFYKLKLGLEYVQQDSFYNANINLAVAQFQFFQPDAAIRAQEEEVYDPVMCMNEKHVPFPPNWTSWDSLVVDVADDSAADKRKTKSLTIGEFVKAFPKLFGGITVDLLFKAGKMEKGVLLYNDALHRKKDEVLNTVLIDKYIASYGALVSDKRNYVILDGDFRTADDNVAKIPRIKYYFK